MQPFFSPDSTFFFENSSPSDNLATLILVALCACFLALLLVDRPLRARPNLSDSVDIGPPLPPGPKPWPILGSLHLFRSSPAPWQTFVRLRALYGDVFRIRLGRKECVVVSSLDTIREVLVQKAHSFSGRPDFIRYDALFGGSRDKSLALCDWSKIQILRRRLAVPYVFPRAKTANFCQLESIIEDELNDYVRRLDAEHSRNAQGHGACFSKKFFSRVCANVFFRYFCSRSYDYEDTYFGQMVRYFDDIFHDINNGFALDFLPWLVPFYLIHLSRLFYYGQFIRRFLVTTLLHGRTPSPSTEPGKINNPSGHSGAADRPSCPMDFLETVLMRTDAQRTKKKKRRLTSDYALYELEDILGGHSAVSCFWTRLLSHIIHRPDIQQKIQEEIERVQATLAPGEPIRLCHRPAMPYTQALILETLRVTTSPIVPHVAVEDATIGGFRIKKDTLIFMNNYYLNTSDRFWKDPDTFDPCRFLTEHGQLFKPDYFIPFGAGKRSCLGFQLVQSISFLTTVYILQHFDIHPTEKDPCPSPRNIISDKVECAKLSVYDASVQAMFRRRSNSPAFHQP